MDDALHAADDRGAHPLHPVPGRRRERLLLLRDPRGDADAPDGVVVRVGDLLRRDLEAEDLAAPVDPDRDREAGPGLDVVLQVLPLRDGVPVDGNDAITWLEARLLGRP